MKRSELIERTAWLRARVGPVLNDLAGLLRHTAERCYEDRCLQAAAALTFTSLLALVPLMTIGLATFSAFPAFGDFRQDLLTFVFENFVPHAGDVAYEYLSRFAENAGRLTIVGMAILGVTAVMLLATIQNTFNQIWRVTEPRPLLIRLLAYWALLTLSPILFGASLALSSYLFAAAQSMGSEALTGPLVRIARLAPVLLTAAGLCLMYNIMPNHPVRWRHSLIGGLAAAVLFEILKKGFGLYVANFPSYEAIYGALAAFPLFLVWAYASWIVVLLGAELTASLPEWGIKRDTGPGPAGPWRQLEVALEILGLLRLAAARGGSLSERQLIAGVSVRPDLVLKAIRDLGRARFLARTERRRWLIARDLDRTSLYDLYRALGFGLDDHDGPAPDQAGPDQAGKDRLGHILAEAKGAESRLMARPIRELLEAPALSEGPVKRATPAA